MLASASFDTSITIWKKKTDSFEIVGNLEGIFTYYILIAITIINLHWKGHENEVKCVAWSNDGCYLASCSRDRSVWIWDVSEGDDYECNSVLSMHNQDVKHVAWHPYKNVNFLQTVMLLATWIKNFSFFHSVIGFIQLWQHN